MPQADPDIAEVVLPVRAVGPDNQPVLVGEWFVASYGFENVIGRAYAVLPRGMMLSFRWGGPFRSLQFVPWGAVLGKVPDPRLFARFGRLFQRAHLKEFPHG